MATLRGSLDRRANPTKHAPLEHVLVFGKRVDISLPAICRFLYGVDSDATRTPLTLEFDYRLKLVKDDCFQRERELRENTKRWIAQNISVDGEGAGAQKRYKEGQPHIHGQILMALSPLFPLSHCC